MAMESTWMIQRAKEELEILEAYHPNRFEYLKVELKTFISEEAENLHLQNDVSSSYQNSLISPSTSVKTQASSTGIGKRKKHSFEIDCVSKKRKFRKSRVDAAIERAKACLLKIREIKNSLSLAVK